MVSALWFHLVVNVIIISIIGVTVAKFEELSFVDTMYFITDTITRFGHGKFVPTHIVSRIATCLFTLSTAIYTEILFLLIVFNILVKLNIHITLVSSRNCIQ